LGRYLWEYFKSPGLSQLKDNLAGIAEVKKEISTPGPLKAKKESGDAYLTKSGIISETNRQRKAHGLKPLKENPKLNRSALLKAKDMFQKGYFAHQSPAGKGVDSLAREVNYQFLAIGENLALGNFKNDRILVQAWMDSPGHRANILNTGYSEIGVAAVKGVYQGETTWMAVQHFGRPKSACPQPSAALKSQIENNNQALKELKSELNQLQAEINASQGAERDEKVKEYNRTVDEYNTLINQTKTLTNQYNSQVNQYNQCLKSS